MSSRWTRTLLRLYPRRVRERYGRELMQLQDELRARGELTRMRLVRDAVVGALLSRSKRQRTAIAAGLLGALLLTGVALGTWNGAPSAPSHRLGATLVARATPAAPYGSACEVGGVAQCSVASCTVFVAQSATVPTATAVVPQRRRSRDAICVSNARVMHPHPVLVARPATSVRTRR